MSQTEKDTLLQRVLSAKCDVAAADALIQEYIPFIKGETAKYLKTSVTGQEDEYSIAMLAFYEAIGAYAEHRGAFLSYAAMHIRSRLIDHYRKEKRHKGLRSMEEEADDSPSLRDSLADTKDELQERELRRATRDEIAEFAQQLATFGLDLTAISEQCPKQERTLRACYELLYYARRHRDVFEELLQTKKLPVTKLTQSGVSRKTIERHRRYIVALLLAYTNGFDIIRGHIAGVLKREGN